MTKISLEHFTTMLGPLGLYQHATIREPLLSEGYCTDDNTRAVMVLLSLRPILPQQEQSQVENLLSRCWKFLQEAEYKPGTYHNFRSADGTWLTSGVSEDMYARLARALTAVIIQDSNASRRTDAEQRYERLFSQLATLTAPRGVAELIIAHHLLPSSFQKKWKIAALVQQSGEQLRSLWNSHASPSWPWFEPSLTYANALLPHGLLGGISASPNHAWEEILHSSTEFLLKATVPDNIFIPIGSHGWYPRGGTSSQDNQQPIEAGTMFDFLLDYQAAFPDQISLSQVAAPYLWFFGANTKQAQIARPDIGASHDGLFEAGVNPNFGAESMLAYLWVEARLQSASPTIQAEITQRKESTKKRASS